MTAKTLTKSEMEEIFGGYSVKEFFLCNVLSIHDYQRTHEFRSYICDSGGYFRHPVERCARCGKKQVDFSELSWAPER